MGDSSPNKSLFDNKKIEKRNGLTVESLPPS